MVIEKDKNKIEMDDEESSSDTADGLEENKLFRFIKEVDMYDDYTTTVKEVIFDIFFTKQIQHTIVFKELVSVTSAVRKVEDYLSEELTIEYYMDIAHKLQFSEIGRNWEMAKSTFEIRGDLMGDLMGLESFRVDENGVLKLSLIKVEKDTTVV